MGRGRRAARPRGSRITREPQTTHKQREEYRGIENPAVNQVVGSDRQFVVRDVGEFDNSEAAEAVTDQRHNYTADEEQHALGPATIRDVSEQNSQRYGGDQESQPCTRFGDLKTAIREFYRRALGVMRHADEHQTNIRKARCKILHWRNQVLTRWHQEEQIERGKQDRPVNTWTEDYRNRDLQDCNHSKLTDFIDCREIACQPDEKNRWQNN